MICLKIELISAVTNKITELGRMYIANDGEKSLQNPSRGDYIVGVCRKNSTLPPCELFKRAPSPSQPRSARSATVLDYPRSSYSVWRLISRAVSAVFPEENGGKMKMSIPENVSRGLKKMAEEHDANHPGHSEPDMLAARDWLYAVDAYDRVD